VREILSIAVTENVKTGETDEIEPNHLRVTGRQDASNVHILYFAKWGFLKDQKQFWPSRESAKKSQKICGKITQIYNHPKTGSLLTKTNLHYNNLQSI